MVGDLCSDLMRDKKFKSLHTEDEQQEFIMIVVEKEKKCTVMKALNEACGLKTPVRGVILSLPVDDVMGLE